MMDKVKALLDWWAANKEMLGVLLTSLFAALVAVGGFAELVVRLTPTKSDDGFMERLGAFLKKAGEKVSWALDKLKIPNNVKGEVEKLPKKEEPK